MALTQQNRVIVTGAGGFIGRAVVAALRAEGREVAGLFHHDPGAETARAMGLVAWAYGPLTLSQLADVAGATPSEIQHCAGSGSVALSLSDPDRDFDSNVMSTQTVLEFARQRGGIRVVLPSSAGVYGVVDRLPIRPDAPCNPISPYGGNKLIAEMLARQYARHWGLEVAIVRLFSVYGAGLRKQLLWDAARKILAGDRVFFGTGNETRDWIHVEDTAALLLQAGRIASPAAPVLNGGTGQQVAIRSILEHLATALDGGHLAAPIRFNDQTRPGDPAHYQADISATLATGWAPRIDLGAGIAAYADWYRSTVLSEPQE